MTDKVPWVGFSIEWRLPTRATIITHKINSDVARTRLREVVDAAVEHALTSDGGESVVTIIVNRTAKNPARRD